MKAMQPLISYIETLITTERDKIKESNAELDTLIQDKFQMEASHRKLVAEVGPIKYIAEFVSGDKADQDMLEKAVQWLIVLIIFVFDPFAVLLLIAAQQSFERHLEEMKEEEKFHRIEETVDHLDEVVKEAEHFVEEAVHPEPEPVMPENIDIPEYELTPEDEEWLDMEDVGEEIPEPYDMADDALYLIGDEEPEREVLHVSELTDEDIEVLENTHMSEVVEPEPPIVSAPMPRKVIIDTYKGPDQAISMTRIDTGYINYNGKAYEVTALKQAFPELKLDFDREVKSGPEWPVQHQIGLMYLRTDETPTQLYISDGEHWNKIDKNVLNHDAYSHEYTKALIKRVGSGDYNPELLNEAEKRHIEELLGRE